jgi:hypothetical protein
MDCTLGSTDDPQNPDKTFLFGPEYMARRVYQLSPPEVLLSHEVAEMVDCTNLLI